MRRPGRADMNVIPPALFKADEAMGMDRAWFGARGAGAFLLAAAVLLAGTFSPVGVGGLRAEEADPGAEEGEFDVDYLCRTLDETPPGEPLLCTASIGPGAPDVEVALFWQREDYSLLIDRIEIAREGEAEPFQSIDPVASRALPDMETNGFEMLDMNFDGYLDMRIIEFLPAGPNIPYLHWLWSPESGRFVSAGFLNELGYTEFDEEERTVFAPWRSSAAEMGEDTYVYEAGKLKQTGRTMRRYTDDGACTQTSYEAVDGQLIKSASGACPEE